MLDDVEQKNLIELRDIHRKFSAIEVPADKLELVRASSSIGGVTIHPRDATTSLNHFRRDVALSATDVEDVSAGTGRGDRRFVRRFVSELQVISFLRLID